jgi:hypothetical protein
MVLRMMANMGFFVVEGLKSKDEGRKTKVRGSGVEGFLELDGAEEDEEGRDEEDECHDDFPVCCLNSPYLVASSVPIYKKNT